MKIHHLGYLVKKITSSIDTFKKMGFTEMGTIIYDETRKADICFMQNGGYVIELVSPKSKDSVVYNLLQKYGNSPYHICYETDNLTRELKRLCDNGFTIINGPSAAPALGNREVVFLMNGKIGLVELVETGEK